MVALFELGARRAADALRNGEHTAEALAEALLARCAASPLNAFISLEADRLCIAARAADERRRRGERLPNACRLHVMGPADTRIEIGCVRARRQDSAAESPVAL